MKSVLHEQYSNEYCNVAGTPAESFFKDLHGGYKIY